MNLLISRPFQTKFSISTNCNILVEDILNNYGKHVSVCNVITENHINVIDGGIKTLITFKNHSFSTNHPLKAIQSILFENTEYDESIFALHGAAVEHNDEAYLFLAATTSGKTTLTAYLTMQGFGYITDDCILMGRNDFRIYPNITPIHLRSGGLEILKNKGFQTKLYTTNTSPPRHIFTPEKTINKPIHFAKIFFINRGDKNVITEISHIERITELLKSPITQYAMTIDYIRFISQLSQKNIYKLTYTSDMDYIAKVITTR